MAFDAKAFMEKFTDRFLKDVDPSTANTLEAKNVIPALCVLEIKRTDERKGKGNFGGSS